MTGQRKKKLPKSFWAWLIQLMVSLLLVGLIVIYRGLPETAPDALRAVDDAFTIVALTYLCVGALLWVSTTGFFDIFGFAVKRALHAFVPGLVKDGVGDYYEYREGRRVKRRSRSLKTTFLVGVVLLAVSFALTGWWYAIA
jgi:flagellar basal body-associated protein FliL